MAKIELTWLGDPKRKNGGRWRKKYRGKKPPFYSSQPNTKAGKALAVEEFLKWKEKVDEEFLQKGKPHQEEYDAAIAIRKDMLQWLALNQDQDPIRTRLLSEVAILETEFKKKSPKPVADTGVLFDPIDRSLMPMAEMMAWLERLESLRMFHRVTDNQQPDRTLSENIDRYINTQRNRSDAGQIKHRTYKSLKERTEIFQAWLTANNRQSISADTVRDFNESLLKQIKSEEITEQTAANRWNAAKSVIHWMHSEELIELPKNLKKPDFKITVTLKEVVPFTADELQIVWDNAAERTKLYALLMLNCGMLPTDIAELKHSEYNGTHITRRRTKTGRRTTTGKGKNVPLVSWLLWDTTKEVLEKHRAKSGQWMLLNDNGSQLVRSKIKDDGEVAIVTNIDSAWDRLTQKMKKKGVRVRPLEMLRKTGSSKLEEHRDFGRYSQYFLGQAPTSMTEARYAKPSQEIFDEAMLWLGKQFNL